MKRIVLIITGVCILGVFFTNFFFLRPKNASVRLLADGVIRLTEDGYVPHDVHIPVGTTVEFRTTIPKAFWPASDPHPTHDIYPDFDPKEPIEASKSWSFQFNRVGTWGYHDHLAPYDTGTITVEPPQGTQNSQHPLRFGLSAVWNRLFHSDTLSLRCASSDQSIKVACWEKAIREEVQKHGIDSAMDLVGQFNSEDISFSTPCHSMAHLVGSAAYELFIKDKSVPLSGKTSYCAFGFYHGFMETLLQRSGNIQEARDFCQHVAGAVKVRSHSALTACYHGVGHGATDIHNPKYAGKEEAVVNDGLSRCRQFAQDDEMKLLCGTGVYDSLSIAYYNNDNGMIVNYNDPLWICRKQNDPIFKESCYRDMMPLVLWLGKSVFADAVPIALKYVEPEYMSVSIHTLASDGMRPAIKTKRVYEQLLVCRGLSKDLYESCIRGLTLGVFQFGSPGHEEEETAIFCANEKLLSQERTWCQSALKGDHNPVKSTPQPAHKV